MNLKIFRSVKQQTASLKLKQQLPPYYFHGVAASSRPEIIPSSDRHPNNHSKKWICQLRPRNVKEACYMLETLSDIPTEGLPEFIVFHNNHLSSTRHRHQQHTATDNNDAAALSFLREILPIGAQFCEDRPAVGADYRRSNAHGKPLNDHVAGICHSFPNHSVKELAALIDVYLPARLALSPRTMMNATITTATATNNNDRASNSDMEAVVQNTDMLVLEEEGMMERCYSAPGFDGLAKRVWEAQEQDGAENTYAICHEIDDARELGGLFSNRSMRQGGE